jgi:ComF family protein
MTLLGRILELLYPPRCPACDASVPADVPLCDVCLMSVERLEVACPRCAQPLGQGPPRPCWRCFVRPPAQVLTLAPYLYGGELATALRRLKFHRRADIARSLAPLWAPVLAVAARDMDLVVPVPLHWRRQARRGFNQAVVLVQEAARLAPAGRRSLPPTWSVGLRRRRATAPQAGLGARARARNVAGAFVVPTRHRARLASRAVLLVDDVATTGATLAAAARALVDGGAARVEALCLARAAD